ncbi:hypothetical protein STEG23_038138, partial [Scotinomys teguina]
MYRRANSSGGPHLGSGATGDEKSSETSKTKLKLQEDVSFLQSGKDLKRLLKEQSRGGESE